MTIEGYVQLLIDNHIIIINSETTDNCEAIVNVLHCEVPDQ